MCVFNSWPNSWKEGANSDATTNASPDHIHHEQTNKQQDAPLVQTALSTTNLNTTATVDQSLPAQFSLHFLSTFIHCQDQYSAAFHSQKYLLHSPIYSLHCFNPIYL
jgi:hypothetical protein